MEIAFPRYLHIGRNARTGVATAASVYVAARILAGMNNSEAPSRTGLSPYETASLLREWIISGNGYARSRKVLFRGWASSTRLLSLLLGAASTVILGLQDLDAWTGLAFALVAVVTVVNAVEPFFNWRSRWVLMEETQYRFYRLQDDLDYFLAKKSPEELQFADVDPFFTRYQEIWDDISRRWLEFRHGERPSGAA